MCNFWSCIITRNRKVFWDKDSNSHEDHIRSAGLKDDKVEDREFVRIEVTPKKPEALFVKAKTHWELTVDEEGTLPKWYTKNKALMEDLVWREWRKAMQETLWKLDLTAAKKTIAEVKAIDYFSLKGKPKKSWEMFYGKDWGAAREATWDAAGEAAREAAWSAAWNAAREATWSAAWEAAREAAREAAWDAAGEAAGEAARDAILLCRCRLARVKGKHLKHAEERMEVWRRGYGLYCDVNGKLYVYGVKKEAKP